MFHTLRRNGNAIAIETEASVPSVISAGYISPRDDCYGSNDKEMQNGLHFKKPAVTVYSTIENKQHLQ